MLNTLFSRNRYRESVAVDVKLWKINCSKFKHLIGVLKSVLSSNEQKRASKLISNQMQEHYIVRHAIFRWILSHELKVAPDRIIFCSDSFGKPFIADYSSLKFNLSSSGELAMIALSWIGEIGVDIEYSLRPQFEETYLLKFFPWVQNTKNHSCRPFSSEEMCVLWTKYEALSKSTGKGIGMTSGGWSLLPEIFKNTRTYHDIPNYKYSFGLTKCVPLEIEVSRQEFSLTQFEGQ